MTKKLRIPFTSQTHKTSTLHTRHTCFIMTSGAEGGKWKIMTSQKSDESMVVKEKVT